MLNAMAYCPKCGGIEVFEDLDKVESEDKAIYDNPTCRGFSRADLEDEHFGVTNAEQLAMALYRLFHNEDEDGWEYLKREAHDDVVTNFRIMALMLCGMAQYEAKEHGLGTIYYR